MVKFYSEKKVYSKHLIFRIRVRNIPYSLPKEIFTDYKERYFDNLTKKHIAVKRVVYKGKSREFMVAYEINISEIRLITNHPLKFHQKFNRIKSKRWRKL
jgi:hypothetical protein